MKIKKYAKSDYCVLTHNRFKCFFTLVDQNGNKEAHSFSVPNLTYSKIVSEKLTKTTARTLGEILIKVADLLDSPTN